SIKGEIAPIAGPPDDEIASLIFALSPRSEDDSRHATDGRLLNAHFCSNYVLCCRCQQVPTVGHLGRDRRIASPALRNRGFGAGFWRFGIPVFADLCDSVAGHQRWGAPCVAIHSVARISPRSPDR